MKKLCLILLMLFLLLSMIHDLSKPGADRETVPQNAIQVKITPGDTVLSVTEEINSLEDLDIEQIIHDFQKLNPGIDYRILSPYTFYYFPLYYDSN
ncbi:hypothetical protein [Oceanobacillus sp. FSL H7-0719]|uniref:hypothetical protein n=1 Tax=Oceanobacillus sp. FSL H7-0719 TaxID=2954507 RepID=UPI0032529F05